MCPHRDVCVTVKLAAQHNGLLAAGVMWRHKRRCCLHRVCVTMFCKFMCCPLFKTHACEIELSANGTACDGEKHLINTVTLSVLLLFSEPLKVLLSCTHHTPPFPFQVVRLLYNLPSATTVHLHLTYNLPCATTAHHHLLLRLSLLLYSSIHWSWHISWLIK